MKLIWILSVSVAVFFNHSLSLAFSNEITNKIKDRTPWYYLEADSEQRQPVYLGATPREIALGLAPVDAGHPVLYEPLRGQAEEQIKMIQRVLIERDLIHPRDAFLIEAWPVKDDYGQFTWAFARWSKLKPRKWRWLDSEMIFPSTIITGEAGALLPVLLDPSKKEDFSLIFDDVLSRDSLYDKPVFGECIWTGGKDDSSVIEAWLPLGQTEEYSRKVKKELALTGSSVFCRLLPQPARLNAEPVVFVFTVKADSITWPQNILWKKENRDLLEMPTPSLLVKNWGRDFAALYRNDMLIFSGEHQAVFPLTKRLCWFKNKNSLDPENQLESVIDYLEERYRSLGIKTVRQRFTLRGIPQSNLLAVIPGSDPGLKPIVIAGHIDTAFCEDVFRATAKRLSSPGADDNATGTALLLSAARVLPGLKPLRDIWLLHLTAEEFPADGAGARYFVSQLLKDKVDIAGVVLADSIGCRQKSDNIFQLNSGDTKASLLMAKIAMDAAKQLPPFDAVLRTRFDQDSSLYNTDGVVFSDNGYSVLHFSEYVNKPENMYHKGHHYSTDTSGQIDVKYASSIAKVAIETAAILAFMPDLP